MNFSLLQKTDDNFGKCEIIYDISADRAINRINSDERKSKFFIDILSKPLTNPENIVYRQETVKDFCRYPQLFDDLQLLFTRYDRIKSDWQQMKLSSPQSSEINPEALLEHSFASLKVTAIFPSTITSFFSNIASTISKYDVKSESLIFMRKRCEEMLSDQSLEKIVSVSQLFRYGSCEDFDFEIAMKFKSDLTPLSCEISEITEKKAGNGGFMKLFKAKEMESPPILSDISETGDDPYTDTVAYLSCALRSIDSLLTEVTNSLYEIFFGLSTELMFYDTALKYISTANEQNVPLCYPEVLTDSEDFIELNGLRELLLLSAGNGGKTVDNSLNLKGDIGGLIVKGLTDSGKTVYLRAIGAAQLFAQAGLPILAESGRLSVRHGLFSHFSSAEEDFLKGSAQGRFDQEAREVSGIIDRFEPYSLLLLNETFQTTSYEEGTKSIYDILRFMPKMKTKYIFVTHLTHLFDYMGSEKVILARTSDNPASRYKIIIEQ